MRKYSYPQPKDYTRCQCGFNRKLGKKVSNGCRLHGVWDERTKTFILPSGTVKQGRRPMFQSFDNDKGEQCVEKSEATMSQLTPKDGNGPEWIRPRPGEEKPKPETEHTTFNLACPRNQDDTWTCTCGETGGENDYYEEQLHEQ